MGFYHRTHTQSCGLAPPTDQTGELQLFLSEEEFRAQTDQQRSQHKLRLILDSDCSVKNHFSSFLSFSSFLVGRQLGWCQKAAAGWDAEESRCWKPPADPEGGTGVPEEHLQRGSHISPQPFYFILNLLSYFSSFPQNIDSLPSTCLLDLQMHFLLLTSPFFIVYFSLKWSNTMQADKFTCWRLNV